MMRVFHPNDPIGDLSLSPPLSPPRSLFCSLAVFMTDRHEIRRFIANHPNLLFQRPFTRPPPFPSLRSPIRP